MKVYIALLRGINVGGHKKIPMAELRELLTKSALKNVKTYIQSGNVIFQSNQKDTLKLEAKIKKAIMTRFGFDVPVLIKSTENFQTIFDECPFEKEKKLNSYFVVLNESPEPDLIKEAEKLTYENEEFIIKNECIYFHSSMGYGRTKFSMKIFERKLKVIGTSRNYNTMVKLLSLSSELN